MDLLKRILLALVSLLIAAVVWLPMVHFLFVPSLDDFRGPGGGRAGVDALAGRHLEIWSDWDAHADEINAMRDSNPEWDFMGRTFLVMSLANMAIREPEKQPQYLATMDRIIDDTLLNESERGMMYFLMSYAQNGTFVVQPARSIFLDGEICMMLASRQLVQEKETYERLFAKRIDTMVAHMSKGPILCGESYPNECWMFCNTMAVAAVRMSDAIDGRDHSAFIEAWLDSVKERLVDTETGLLASSFTVNGHVMDGPEGSSLWMSAHCLRFVDDRFARDQYTRARNELKSTVLGFGFAREWPKTCEGRADIDSGPIVPFLEVSAGSSGLAFVGAGAFDDDDYFVELLTTLHFAGFPVEEDGQVRFAASNQVGDAVMLYACVQGPLLDRVKQRSGP